MVVEWATAAIVIVTVTVTAAIGVIGIRVAAVVIRTIKFVVKPKLIGKVIAGEITTS